MGIEDVEGRDEALLHQMPSRVLRAKPSRSNFARRRLTVSVVAFTQEAGVSGASGIILGLWAFASMLGGIVFGSRHWRLPLARPSV